VRPLPRAAADRPTKAGRLRLDALLVARGLAATRAEAARLILAGRVRLGTEPADKPGRLVRDDAALALVATSPYVSRGGEKLAAALAAFGTSPRDRVCLDVGASTGGFTDCLLQHGARHVYAVDVGHGQLHSRLRADPRVSVLEGLNARGLEAAAFDPAPSLASVDVSFISLEKVLPAVAGVLDPAVPRDVLALVKPQFEVGRGQVGKGGVVRDAGRHREVLVRLAAFAAAHGLAPRGVAVSPLRGPKGNREFFLHLEPGAVPQAKAALDKAIEVAVANSGLLPSPLGVGGAGGEGGPE
jgi:23S rRNA (cytidine1920-2'-O)/16S rRNA (cytidine1409-2'-O)-methyltransferase